MRFKGDMGKWAIRFGLYTASIWPYEGRIEPLRLLVGAKKRSKQSEKAVREDIPDPDIPDPDSC